MKHVAIFLLSILMIACSSRPVPNKILLPEQMKKIVFDLIKADEFLNGFAIRDTTETIRFKRSSLYTQVFALHHTTREEFYKSYEYYQQHPDKHKIFFDSLYADVNRPKPVIAPKLNKPVNFQKPR